MSDAGDQADANDPGPDGSAEPNQPDAGVELGPDVKVGEFSVRLVAPNPSTATEGYTALLGKAFDGPEVEPIVWEVADEADGCKLLTPRVPFCDPACGADACVEDNTCKSYPVPLSAGTLKVSGLHDVSGAAVEVEIDPRMGSYTTPGSVALPYPAFAEGDPIRFEASGAEIAPFTLEGVGIAPLELLGPDSYPIESGTPIELAWTPKGSAGTSRVQVEVDISHHGGVKGLIQCDVPDTGAMSIPAGLLDQLVALGVAGFPVVVITRGAITSTLTSAGRIELKIYEYVQRPITIEGLVSCGKPEDCPGGQICRDDQTCG